MVLSPVLNEPFLGFLSMWLQTKIRALPDCIGALHSLAQAMLKRVNSHLKVKKPAFLQVGLTSVNIFALIVFDWVICVCQVSRRSPKIWCNFARRFVEKVILDLQMIFFPTTFVGNRSFRSTQPKKLSGHRFSILKSGPTSRNDHLSNNSLAFLSLLTCCDFCDSLNDYSPPFWSEDTLFIHSPT